MFGGPQREEAAAAVAADRSNVFVAGTGNCTLPPRIAAETKDWAAAASLTENVFVRKVSRERGLKGSCCQSVGTWLSVIGFKRTVVRV